MTKQKITSQETKRLRDLQDTLLNVSRASGMPQRLKNVLYGICDRIDKLLKDENIKKRLSTINVLIELVTKIISILRLM